MATKTITYLGPLGGVQLADGTELLRDQPVAVEETIADELTTLRPTEFVEVI